MYEDTKQFIDNNLVFYVEDDIKIPPDSLKKLLPLMDRPKVCMATGRVMSRQAKDKKGEALSQALKLRNNIWFCLPKKDKGVEVVEASTWGCTLIKSSILRKIYLHLVEKTDWGQDAIFADAVRGKYKILIDWSVHTTHYNWDGRIFE